MSARPADIACRTPAAQAAQLHRIASAADNELALLTPPDIYSALDGPALVRGSSSTEPVGQTTVSAEWDTTVFANSDIVPGPNATRAVTVPNTSRPVWYVAGFTAVAEQITTAQTLWQVILTVEHIDPLTAAISVETFSRWVDFRNVVGVTSNGVHLWTELVVPMSGGNLIGQYRWESSVGTGNINVSPLRFWCYRLAERQP